MGSKAKPVCIPRDQLVRDLLWAINSPSLIVDSPDHPTLSLDQVDPDHLHRTLGNFAGHRVGVYFESLVGYWLRHIRSVEIIAHGQPIRDANRTLGEIDFVFRDEQGKLTHWEVAVKFYLYEPTRPIGDSHFIGPNAKDNFEKKMVRMFDHQLPLSRRYFPEVELRQAFVKGQIFYSNANNSVAVFPEKMNPQHTRGSFLREHQIEDLAKTSSDLFVRLRKPFWLSRWAVDLDSCAPLAGKAMIEPLRHHFATICRPVLLSEVNQSRSSWIEMKRIFVVPDHWPLEPEGPTDSPSTEPRDRLRQQTSTASPMDSSQSP